jgi:hypothetical protein
VVEFGRHAGFRFLWREPCEFESRRPHQAAAAAAAAGAQVVSR